MRRIAPLCVLAALSLVVPAVAQTSLVGSWKQNIAKSKSNPGPGPRSRTINWETAPGGLKFTVDEVNSQGQKSHTETLQKSDGTESPIEGGGEPPQTRSAKRVDDHTYEIVTKVNGKVVSTRKVVISPDGKTMTSTVKGTNARGQAFDNVEIYEKQ